MPRTYKVPVRYTIYGWVSITAEDHASAVKKAKELNENGINLTDIQDPEESSEVLVDHLESES